MIVVQISRSRNTTRNYPYNCEYTFTQAWLALLTLCSSHPDKIQLAENQTKDDADAKFVELTKAYKSLTDEITRENLAKYGNPDGPQQREDKIAIPQWVVEGRNNIWVLGAYGLVLGGGIPFVVVSGSQLPVPR